MGSVRVVAVLVAIVAAVVELLPPLVRLVGLTVSQGHSSSIVHSVMPLQGPREVLTGEPVPARASVEDEGAALVAVWHDERIP